MIRELTFIVLDGKEFHQETPVIYTKIEKCHHCGGYVNTKQIETAIRQMILETPDDYKGEPHKRMYHIHLSDGYCISGTLSQIRYQLFTQEQQCSTE